MAQTVEHPPAGRCGRLHPSRKRSSSFLVWPRLFGRQAPPPVVEAKLQRICDNNLPEPAEHLCKVSRDLLRRLFRTLNFLLHTYLLFFFWLLLCDWCFTFANGFYI